MPNHIAHSYFGQRVLSQLPKDLREVYQRDLPVFRLGLYGPDPLIFSFQTKPISDKLHHHWRKESLPALEHQIRWGTPLQRSFAGGYLLHQLLDEAIHPTIYRHMEETNASHFRMEIRLDRLISEEMGWTTPPEIVVGGKERAAWTAADFLAPATQAQYLRGLWRMATLMKVFRHLDESNAKRTTQMEKRHADGLRELLEEAVTPAARCLTELLTSAQAS